jgi:hypothetical protein
MSISFPIQFSVPRFKTREDGGRTSATLKYKGYAIEVATGYDVSSDRFPFHVYLKKLDGGSRKKVDCLPGHDNDMEAALNRGVAFATAYIDAAP